MPFMHLCHLQFASTTHVVIRGLIDIQTADTVHATGQVIRHKRFEYRGVIIGYDTSCIAPEGWIQVIHTCQI